MNDLVLVKTVFLQAPLAKVWAYLTQGDKLGKWFHPAKTDMQAGEKWTTYGAQSGDPVCWGMVSEMRIEDGADVAVLRYSFTHNHLQGLETDCVWTLEAVDGGTILTLRHYGFEAFPEEPFAMAANHDEGWDEHFADLRKVVCS